MSTLPRVLVLTFALTLQSCASLTTGIHEQIRVTSDPPADVTLDCAGSRIATTATPAVVKIRRNAGDCILTLSKTGYTDETVIISQGVNPMYWGNFLGLPAAFFSEVGLESRHSSERTLEGELLVGGVAGWLIDYGTGAIHRHSPNRIHAVLRARPDPER
jgi:hypothetical protein